MAKVKKDMSGLRPGPETEKSESRKNALPEDRSPMGMSVLAVGALLTVALAGLHYVQGVFAPLFLGLTLVLAFRPVGRALIRWGVPGWLAVAVNFLTLITVFVGTVSVVAWSLVPVPQTLLTYRGRFESTVTSIVQLLDRYGIQTTNLDKLLEDLNYNTLISWAWTLVDSLSSVGGLLAVVVIALFFISLDTMVMTARGKVMRISHKNLSIALAGFEKRVRAYWIISTVFGIIVAVVDVFALQLMGIPLAVTWGMWAFITNYIPNIGFIIGVLPPMLIGLLDQGWQTMVYVCVVYSVINVVIQTFIQPKFTGDVVGLSPTVTFFSLVVWTSIVGLLGSILAIPLTLFFKALLIDSDPRTRWLDVFFISENDTRKRDENGWYDLTHAPTVRPAEAELAGANGKINRPGLRRLRGNVKIRQLSRKLRRSEKQNNSLEHR